MGFSRLFSHTSMSVGAFRTSFRAFDVAIIPSSAGLRSHAAIRPTLGVAFMAEGLHAICIEMHVSAKAKSA
jgi:hypothetical protein